MARVAFVGLGVMGAPMAGHLVAAGHEVTVWNRGAERAAAWATEHPGATVAATAAEAAAAADVVLMCVGNDASVLEVVAGPHGILDGAAPGTLVVDHTTVAASTARAAHAACVERGARFLDAPVSGGQAGAVNGALTIMVGGAEADYAVAEPIISAYAAKSRLLGEVGAGQLAKMVNQICVAGVVAGLAEGLHFARRAGLEPQAVIDAIGKGAAQSWQMDNRHRTMLAGEYAHGFAVDWMRKDLAIVLDEARRNGAHLPATALVDQLYAEVQAMGGGRWDTSSLLARLERDEETQG